MTRHACATSVALLLLSLAIPVLGQNYFLYTPKPVTAEEKGQSKDGVLVREITVQKGDTLSALSRRFSGRASYYPQILLFNDIKNPHLIHIGDNLKVPVTRGESTEPHKSAVSSAPKQSPAIPKQAPAAKSSAQPVSELPLSDLKKSDSGKSRKRVKREQKHVEKKQNKSAEATLEHDHSGEPVSAQKLYDQAFSAYRHGDCKSALMLFDRYQADQPESSNAADVSLYKADCYLKLSGQ